MKAPPLHVDKGFDDVGNASAKGWENFFENRTFLKTPQVFNAFIRVENVTLRADLTVFPICTPIITITIKTYILKNGKREIQGIVVRHRKEARL